ncbi:hypothetical protein [Nocardioides marmoribigeumensis]|uniref:Glycoside-hydrolase family GH114 TIM-barrel domain-containing protein n=1 Tax=Nocardioides marmoribigeumensis TaxID=433649 RepID=A0ABU2BVG3_9ACTN|nr:hypothetical protein [Nocardioides marmoribigeumensis]MDR7362256.1 hypothetical protein [Nocardioides marmoribigeumensis]
MLAVAATALVGLSLVQAPANGAPDGTSARATTVKNPFTNSKKQVRNGVFYYDGSTPITMANVSTLKRKWGRAAVVVTTAKHPTDETPTVNAIHATGAKAYRYIQFFWAPSNGTQDRLDISNGDGAFCFNKGTLLDPNGTPAVGRRTDGGKTTWWFVDANERAVQTRIKSILADLKADGWDGVMFDRGQAATQYIKDINGRPVWSAQSQCTSDPVVQGATFADSYVSMLRLARAVGLGSVMNNGRSPFDRPVRMRPDPKDADCRAARWSACTFKNDIWNAVDLILSEVPTAPRIKDWKRHFAANKLNERDATHGHRVLNLITTSSLGGRTHQNRRDVSYAWSRVKLFNLPVAVNTGDGGCGPDGSDSGVCNRYGNYPDLVNTTFGAPRTTGPSRTKCASGSLVSCVWFRPYALGMDVVNVKGTTSKPTLSTGLSTCRYVKDVYTRKYLAGGRCVKKFTIAMGAWTGHPLHYSTRK